MAFLLHPARRFESGLPSNMKELFFDIETYSSVDLKTAGAYRYIESPDFSIILLAYAFGDEPVKVVDVELEGYPQEFLRGMRDPDTLKLAYNAQFERICFRKVGIDVPIPQWQCIMVKSAYCGYPLSLEQVSKAMHLEEKGKLSIGKVLIRYFCKPNKDGKRTDPARDLDRWELFKKYCINDVVSEREIYRRLQHLELPPLEKQGYAFDQEMNDRGVLIDLPFAQQAIRFDHTSFSNAYSQLKIVTGLENPNSVSQLKEWLIRASGKEIKELTKDSIKKMLPETDGAVHKALKLRQLISKSSVKKYIAMENCVCADSRARGMFQFYGANRTGRWTSKLIQLQSLPQNHMKDLDLARKVVREGDYELAELLWPSIPEILSELIRTAFIAPPGKTFAVSDFSAIEARVISWVAQEEWRLEVFRTHGKIYEAAASLMFGVPIEQVTKGSELRQRGKTSELALGYAGGVEALTRMDREGRIPDSEKPGLVKKWRKANPAIVRLWSNVEEYAMHTIKSKKESILDGKLFFRYEKDTLTIELPSGRKLCYVSPSIGANRWGSPSIKFMGVNQDTKQWFPQETYGGKLVENIIQAAARDVLAWSIKRLNEEGLKDIVLLIHDEVVVEVPKDQGDEILERIKAIMGEEIPWMQGLPLKADGYVTDYYKKD